MNKPGAVDMKNMSKKDLLLAIQKNKKEQEMTFSSYKKLEAACPHRHENGTLAITKLNPVVVGGEKNMVECYYCKARFQYKKYNELELTKLKDEIENIVQLYKVYDQKASIGTFAQVGLSNLVIRNVIDHTIRNANQNRFNESNKGNGKQKRDTARGSRTSGIMSILAGGVSNNKHGYSGK